MLMFKRLKLRLGLQIQIQIQLHNSNCGLLRWTCVLQTFQTFTVSTNLSLSYPWLKLVVPPTLVRIDLPAQVLPSSLTNALTEPVFTTFESSGIRAGRWHVFSDAQHESRSTDLEISLSTVPNSSLKTQLSPSSSSSASARLLKCTARSTDLDSEISPFGFEFKDSILAWYIGFDKRALRFERSVRVDCGAEFIEASLRLFANLSFPVRGRIGFARINAPSPAPDSVQHDTPTPTHRGDARTRSRPCPTQHNTMRANGASGTWSGDTEKVRLQIIPDSRIKI
ncbi:hypothetical protein B0H14DRAFT_2563445 [Mycena olivaceomarginata]|nr:hypothetical protein B0H14DRAFT_2563445 [Mycena olivaceomarginata]